jgi:hypothetical protein
MIRFLKFPSVPQDILARLSRNWEDYKHNIGFQKGNFWRSNDCAEEISTWCRDNICESMEWGFQLMSSDTPIHTDAGTDVKLIYLIEPGGSMVKTNFYHDDGVTISHSFVIPPYQWHILKASVKHSVQGIESGQTRFALMGRVFHD